MGELLIKSRARPFPVSHYSSIGQKTRKYKGLESLRCRAAPPYGWGTPHSSQVRELPKNQRVSRACTKGKQCPSLQPDGYWDAGPRSQCSHGPRVGHREFLEQNLQTRDSSCLENSVDRRLEELPVMTGPKREGSRGSRHTYTVCWASVMIFPCGPSGHPRR